MAKASNKFSRREFIQRTTRGAAGLAALQFAGRSMEGSAAGPSAMSKVVVVSHKDALKGSAFNADVIQVMMDAGIRNLTGIQDVGEAWKSLCPGISRSSVIGIKINCLFVHHTHKEVTNAVTGGLKRMVVDGSPFPENNIIVWDKSDGDLHGTGGYTLNTSQTGVRCFGTNHYGSVSYPIDEGDNQKLSSLITETCQFLINLSVLKNHNTGVSLSMKNHYGSIDNLGGPHMHNYPLAKVLPSLNALPPIREKQVICICDAIQGIIYDGPSAQPQVAPKSLILSRDPVAHDFTGAQMLTAYGCTTSSLTGLAKHVAVASQPPYSLGTCDPAQIERIDVTDPEPDSSSSVEPFEAESLPGGFALFQNHPNPFNGRTWISYRLPQPAHVRIRIWNGRGQSVLQLFEGRQGPGVFQAAWDGTGPDGSRMPSGIYFAVFEADGFRSTVKMQLVQ